MSAWLWRIFLVIFLSFLYFIPLSVFAQKSKIDSLKSILPTSKDTIYVKVLLDLCWEYRNVHSDSAEKYGNQALVLAEKYKRPYLLTLANQYLGVVAQTRGKYALSLEYYYKVIEIAEKNNFLDRLGYLYQSMGRMNQAQGNYAQAIDNTNKSLEYFVKLKNDLGISYCYLTLGEIATNQKEYQKGLDYYKKSLDIRQKLQLTPQIAATYSLIGENYFLQEQYDQAIKYLYLAKSNFDKVEDLRGKIGVLNKIAKIYILKKDWDKALDYLIQSEKLARQTGITEYIKEAYQNIAEIYVNKNDYVNAYQYQHLLSNYKDTILNREKEKNAQEIEAKYMNNQRKKDIELLQIENKDQKLFIFYGSIIAFLSILLIVFLFFNIRQKQKTNKQLLFQQKQIQETNAKLEKLNAEIISQNTAITKQKEEQEKINVFKDKLFSIISHDLRNPLASLKGSLLLFKMDFLKEEERAELVEKLSRDLQSSSYLLDNLLNWAKNQMQGLKYNPQQINLTTLIEENILLLKPQAESKHISLTCNVLPDISVFADVDMVKVVIRNLIHNAIKYTPNHGQVRISAFISESYVLTSVHDTGTGISKEDQQKLFSAEHFSKHGTSNEKGSGLGLLLSKDFVEKNQGAIWVESAEYEGSTFTFTLPKYQT
jgi:signal transduction histidine kinase